MNKLLPQIRQSETLPDVFYNPAHCLGIYHEHVEPEGALDFPTMLLGEAVAPLTGLGCTLLEGFPDTPPGGSLVLGTWDALCETYPHLFEGLERPSSEDGYLLHLGRYGVLAGNTPRGCIAAVQTMIQLLAAHYTEQGIAGVRILDAPVCPQRAVMIDLDHYQPRVESIMRVMGAMNSFHGNSLHLLVPRRFWQTGEEMIPAPDIEELHAVANDYGIDLVLWLDVVPLASEAASQEELAEQIATVVDEWFVEHLGIGGLARSYEDASGAALCCVLQERLSVPLFGGESLLKDVYGTLDPTRWHVVLPEVPDSATELAWWRTWGAPVSVFAPTDGLAVCPQHPDVLTATIDSLRDLIVENTFAGCGLFVRGAQPWELSFWAIAAVLGIGWNPQMSSQDAMRRFSFLVHGDRESAFTDLVGSLASVLEPSQAECLYHSLIAQVETPEDVTCLEAVFDDSVEARLDIAERKLGAFLSGAEHNEGLLAVLRIACKVLRFSLERVRTMRRVSDILLADAPGACHHVGELLEQLHGQAVALRQQILQFHTSAGTYGALGLSLKALAGRIRTCARVLQESDAAGTTPSLEMLGLTAWVK